jgi:hypothetical protein
MKPAATLGHVGQSAGILIAVLKSIRLSPDANAIEGDQNDPPPDR